MVRLILRDIYGLTLNAISRVVVHKRDITCSALPNVEQRVRSWRAGDTCDWPLFGLHLACIGLFLALLSGRWKLSMGEIETFPLAFLDNLYCRVNLKIVLTDPRPALRYFILAIVRGCAYVGTGRSLCIVLR